ncbi:3069_t:CDS:2, partial [Diversispora eburnea]
MSFSHDNKDLFKSDIENRFNTFDYNTFEDVILIGTGGFGEVKKAYSNILKKYVALKCLRDPNDNDNDDEFYKQFMNEANNSTEKYYLVLQYAEDDYISVYSNAWEGDPNLRPTIEKICDSLENIQLENVYIISSENKSDENIPMDIDMRSDTVSNDQASSLDDADNEKEASISESAKNSLGVVGDAVQPYLPLFSTVTIIISEINNIYADVNFNKKICNSLMDRVNIAELSIRNLQRRKKENEKNFRDVEYFMAFRRFIEVMKNIKQFIDNISTLSEFQKYFHANSVKVKFESLTSEFETVMNDLHFTTLLNDDQRRIDQESLSSDLEEMAK